MRCVDQGFTLIEILVATLVTSLLLCGVLTVYQQGIVFWRTEGASLEVQDNLRIGLDRMTREVRSASRIRSCKSNEIVIEDASGKHVKYYFDPAGNQLLRMSNWVSNAVVNQIDLMIITREPESGVVTLRLEGGHRTGEPVALETTVWVRASGE